MVYYTHTLAIILWNNEFSQFAVTNKCMHPYPNKYNPEAWQYRESELKRGGRWWWRNWLNSLQSWICKDHFIYYSNSNKWFDETGELNAIMSLLCYDGLAGWGLACQEHSVALLGIALGMDNVARAIFDRLMRKSVTIHMNHLELKAAFQPSTLAAAFYFYFAWARARALAPFASSHQPNRPLYHCQIFQTAQHRHI